MRTLGIAAALCHASYPENGSRLLRGAKVIEVGSDVVYVVRVGNAIWIVVRGTDSIKDLAHSFRTARSPSGLHAGFEVDSDLLLDPIYRAVPEAIPVHGVFVTGHSRGGALALIIASALSFRMRVSSTITFGQPRIGDSLAAEKAAQLANLTACVLPNDPVPYLPLSFLGYAQTDVLVLRGGRTVSVVRAAGGLFRRSWEFVRFVWTFRRPTHSMRHYLRAVAGEDVQAFWALIYPPKPL